MSLNPGVIALWIFPLLLAVVLHECAHGYMANRLGDNTAASVGRLTLNPLVHIDPIGTIALPALLLLTGSPIMFGWAKPVPVSFGRLRNPRRDMVLVAMAGPAMNLFLAALSAACLALLGPYATGATESGGGFEVAVPLAMMCTLSLQLNVVLAVFNMLPIPPLDGGRVAVGLLPRDLAIGLARLEPYGFLIIMGLLFTGVLQMVLGPVTRGIWQALLAVFL